MKKTTLTILGGAAVATALLLSSNNVQPPPVPMFGMAWNNNYDRPEVETTLVIATDRIETPISQWKIISMTTNGFYSEPRTNGNRFYACVNIYLDTMVTSLPW